MSGYHANHQNIRDPRLNHNNPEDIVLCLIIAVSIVLFIIILFICKRTNTIQRQSNPLQNPSLTQQIIRYQVRNSLFDYKCDNENSDICTICLDDLKSNNVVITECNHIFHKDCLLRWININLEKRQNADCPNCKFQL